MEYCAPLGLPHSQFLNWHEDDQDKALAFLLFKGEICPNCGTSNDGWVDDRGRWLDEPKYEVVTHKCYGCEEIGSLKDSIPDHQKSSVYVVARKRKPGTESEVILRETEMERREFELRKLQQDIPLGGLYG